GVLLIPIDGQRGAIVIQAQRLQCWSIFSLRVVVVGRGTGAALATYTDRTGFGSSLVHVVRLLIGSLGVAIKRAGTRGNEQIGNLERSPGEIADNRGAPAQAEIARKLKRKRADATGEHRRSRIARQDNVGNLFGGEARAADFDHVFARSSVEKI